MWMQCCWCTVIHACTCVHQQNDGEVKAKHVLSIEGPVRVQVRVLWVLWLNLTKNTFELADVTYSFSSIACLAVLQLISIHVVRVGCLTGNVEVKTKWHDDWQRCRRLVWGWKAAFPANYTLHMANNLACKCSLAESLRVKTTSPRILRTLVSICYISINGVKQH